ncbi:MAG: glycosyltransferase [Alphaproteobacteria bacterium]|jgi:hopene-associated glycosyltransferase HpnB|nr:glycosyltransferase [Alphaproteobacteria bacterium]
MSSPWSLAAALPLLVWLHLLLFRGGFWRADQRLDGTLEVPAKWPEVVVVVPARDEAANVGEAVRSLLAQDYGGAFTVILVDDQSSDGTAETALAAAATTAAGERLRVVRTADLPGGWAGKVWAMAAGVDEAGRLAPKARYVLFTDADIRHPPDGLARLVAKAEREHLDLVSLMVLLAHRGMWQRLLVPAFVFFFQKLYPFAWVNDSNRPTAAAAGGIMLVRREALSRAGGLAAIRDALIDDCTLAHAIADKGGRLWLGLAEAARSLRVYDDIAGVWRMVARSAYTQLRYSPWLLAGTVIAMVVIYLLAPAIVFAYPWHGHSYALQIALLSWVLMAIAFGPTLKLYRQPFWIAFLLPVAGLLYTLMTLDSARLHALGRGGAWKGRVRSSEHH